jgi:hypothetical protein
VRRPPLFPFVVTLLLMVATLGVGFLFTPGTTRTGTDVAIDSATPQPAQKATPQPISGNFSMYIPGPSNVRVTSASTLLVQLRFDVVNYGSGDNGLLVRVPGGAAIFPAHNGSFEVPFGSQTHTVTGPGWQNLSATPLAVPLSTWFNTTSTKFSMTSWATISTQTVAVMTQEPWGSITLGFQWEWNLTSTAGTPLPPSGWGGAHNLTQEVVPAEYAQLESTSPHRLARGQTFDVCLSGPVNGRAFGLWAQNSSTGASVGPTNVTVPGAAVLPFCWGLLLPGPLPAQTVLLKLWNWENVPSANQTWLLLYVIPITVVNATAVNPDVLGLPVSTWLSIATVAAIAVAVGLVGYAAIWFIGRRSRAKPPKEGTPDGAPASANAGGAQPPPPVDGGGGRDRQ